MIAASFPPLGRSQTGRASLPPFLRRGNSLEQRRTGRRPFVIEYQHDPRIVKAIAWDNIFWNAALGLELAAVCRNIVSATPR